MIDIYINQVVPGLMIYIYMSMVSPIDTYSNLYIYMNQVVLVLMIYMSMVSPLDMYINLAVFGPNNICIVSP
jgi:hypothetical protein